MATTTPPPPKDASVESADAISPTADASALAGNAVVADSLGEYLSGQWKRIRGGESGVLPVVIALILIVVVFQIENSNFLSALNLVQLLQQGSIYIVFGMAEIFVLLLGDIDLSIGFSGGIGAAIIAELAAPPHNLPWFPAVLAGVAVCAVLGAVAGTIITRLGLPSFIVTLAGYLGYQGFLLYLINADPHSNGGTIQVTNGFINGIVNNNLSVAAGWIVLVVVVALYAAGTLFGYQRRRSSGLVAPPFSLLIVKIGAFAVAGLLLVLVCNADRGNFTTIKGMPYIIPAVLALIAIYTFVLDRTRFGRYVYAIGGNAEAARRAGVKVRTVRTICFVLAGFTAGLAGLVYESQLGSISTGIDGGTLVLYAVAVAVIGGTSLFGGRGRMVHALIGGLVIAAIANGMDLLGLSADAQEMVNALVLLAAVIVDALARRRSSA